MITLCEYNFTFLEKSWDWLNDSEIKEKTNTPNFTKEQQEKWFKGINSKTDYLIWGIKADKKPIGVCGLKNITDNDCEYWGYIGEKDFWGKGIGSQIMNLMIEKAYSLQLKSIWLKVVSDNLQAIGLYNKFRFITESEQNGIIFMRKVL
jgi:RimJ/RimL family protein N-acetyltransferase